MNLYKRLSHHPTFYSRNSKTRIVYILIRRRHLATVTDCKTISYDTSAPQHRPLIAVLRIKPPIKQREVRTGPPRFREKKEEIISLTRLPTITNVKESWSQIKDTIHKAASATLGVTKPGKLYIHRDTWLWYEDVEMKVHEKKRVYHKFLDGNTIAKNSNRETKKATAVTRAVHYKNLYDQLATPDDKLDTRSNFICQWHWRSEVAVSKRGRQPCRPNQNQVAEENTP